MSIANEKTYSFTDQDHFKFMTRNFKWEAILFSMCRKQEYFNTVTDINKNFSILSK